MTTDLPTEPLRAVTADEVEAFWRDGVVCLRGIPNLHLRDTA